MTKTPKNKTSEELVKYRGDLAVDDRGVVRFVNDFDFKKVKRFYQIENFSRDTIRAFHGHKKEGKYVYVTEGSIILCAVKIDNFQKPLNSLKVERHILSAKKPQIIYIPPMYANGFKSLEEKTKVLFFSTRTLDESLGDDYRFPADYFGMKIWETENR